MTAHGPAVAELDAPDQPRFLLALTHGAGGPADAPDLAAAAAAARGLGGAVASITQPYRVRGGRAPGPAVRQDEAWTEIVAGLRQKFGDLPLIQGGRSNGARVACRTAAAVGAQGVVALAFPLHPPGHPERSRAAELRGAHLAGVAVLVVTGERDPFGIPEAEDAGRVIVLPGETHALSRNPAAVKAAVTQWLTELAPGWGAWPALRGGRLPAVPRAAPAARKRKIGGTVRRDLRSAGKQLPGILEDHDTVAEQAPALLWVAHDSVGRLAIRC